MDSFKNELSKSIGTQRLKEILSSIQVHIGLPEAENTALLHTIAVNILPSFWEIGNETSSIQDQLVNCFATFPGLKLLCARLDELVYGDHKNAASIGMLYLDVLEASFNKLNLKKSRNTIMCSSITESKKRSTWSGFTFFLGNFGIINSSAAFLSAYNISITNRTYNVSNMAKYVEILSKKIASLLEPQNDSIITDFSHLYHYLLRPGQQKAAVSALFPHLQTYSPSFQNLFRSLNPLDQNTFLTYLFLDLDQKYSHFTFQNIEDSESIPGALATLLRLNFLPCDFLQWLEFNWEIPLNLFLMRSIVLSCSVSYKNVDKIKLKQTVNALFSTWSASHFLKNYSVVSQERLTVYLILLLSKLDREFLHECSKSFLFTNGISNRLESLDEGIRLQGMVLAEIIAQYFLVSETKSLKFDVPLMASSKATYLKSLTELNDQFQPLDSLCPQVLSAKNEKKHIQDGNAPNTQESVNLDKTFEDSSDHNERKVIIDDLQPYEISDSESEDSVDDPTISKTKVDTPKYIQSLCRLLLDVENYDAQKVAIETAPELIQRKSLFGSEVKDHAKWLLEILVGLQNRFDLPNFDRLQLSSLCNLLSACPEICGPEICSILFIGDFSLRQKTMILSSIAMAAVSLANDEERFEFPTKKLPQALHDQFFSITLDKLSFDFEKKLTMPIMEEYQDKIEGPKPLQTRIISRQTEIESRKRSPKANKLSKVVDKSLFLLLTNGFMMAVKRSSFTDPLFLVYYLKTMGILFSQSCTSKIEGLSRMVDEYIIVLTEVCRLKVETPEVNEALLFNFLVVLESTPGSLLASQHGKSLLGFEAYTQFLFNSADSGEKVKSVAAMVLLEFEKKMKDYRTLALEKILDDSSNLSLGRFGLAGL
ncbi:Tel2/Rad-5/Clk-2 family protein Tel2 [Schizosaccharomyces cryophilus OY26]|uniref:Tel2/Rad-5/Clk-2 family protein Tel2 n=1 Tax=Schizosaccharomyces cryophilus (strain OY26 / ATCC MYA-4695 / CBS 11777 / NBRC 106824 / NRRL Y48691) TaxID=653667 RepID=S9X070_SCHCR|nr:Tel2/Rad-5/Clk-2 family protein Tel2 [Schizosaccharomyces cryophilus OY26]EPY50322.1 Tel2/Rad-5/Clk-2 family protein Tel2 [Schizosaccharomyces cryophilus OY26]